MGGVRMPKVLPIGEWVLGEGRLLKPCQYMDTRYIHNRCMADENNPNEDYETAGERWLTTYEVEGSSPITLVEADIPAENMNVEVEYVSESYGLNEKSLRTYLEAITDCDLTQERLTRVVYEDLKSSLETGNVFVTIKSTSKITSMGSI